MQLSLFSGVLIYHSYLLASGLIVTYRIILTILSIILKVFEDLFIKFITTSLFYNALIVLLTFFSDFLHEAFKSQVQHNYCKWLKVLKEITYAVFHYPQSVNKFLFSKATKIFLTVRCSNYTEVFSQNFYSTYN